MWHRDYWIVCTNCGEQAWCDGKNTVSAGSYAVSMGWKVRPVHLCPQCAAQQKLETDGDKTVQPLNKAMEAM